MFMSAPFCIGGFLTVRSTCALFACLGLGVGGNLPVDAAIFLEFLPFASGNVLSSMAIFWSVGNLIARYVQIRKQSTGHNH